MVTALDKAKISQAVQTGEGVIWQGNSLAAVH